jgi:hypothetical protein
MLPIHTCHIFFMALKTATADRLIADWISSRLEEGEEEIGK